MTSATAPIELTQIGLNPHDFKFSDQKSWRGPCPVCAGKRRFVMFTDHDFPLWHGYCSDCGYKIKVWEKVRTPITEDQRTAARAREVAQDRERQDLRRRKLEEFTTHELYLELSERMENAQINWWESQGIPEGIQKYLRLGWIADKPYYDHEENLRHSPAYTIPWFDINYQFRTMQYRLSDPSNPTDRYRFEKGLGGGAEHYYITDPQESIKSKLIISEGAKKGIVTWCQLSNATQYSTVATVSADTVNVILPLLEKCEVAYYIPDPDSFKVRPRAKYSPYQNAMLKFKEAGALSKIRPVKLPYKIDDGYNNGWIDRAGFANLLNTARSY